MSNTKPIVLSASIPVKRIIEGDTISLYFSTNGVALFQGVNPDTGVVTPAWTDDITNKKCPVITPHVGSARKQAVSLISHKWSYNGVAITFAAGSGWVTSTNLDGKFKLNTADGSIAIIKNLAEKDKNEDSDLLTYEGMASVGAASYEMKKSVDILISMLGGSAYVGGITATSTMLGIVDTDGNEIKTTTLTFWLVNSAGGDVSSFSVKLYRGSETTAAATTSQPKQGITIHRDKTGDGDKLYVDSHQLFIAEFYVPGTSTAVYRCGISIDDAADLYQYTLYSSDTGVGTNNDFTMKPRVTSSKTGKVVTMDKGSVVFEVLRDDTMKVVRSQTVNFTNNAEFNNISFKVTAADTQVTENGKTTEFDVTTNSTIDATVIVD